MTEEQFQFVEPCEKFRDALAAYIEEFCNRNAGESFWQEHREEVLNDFAGFLARHCPDARESDLPDSHVPQTQYWLVRGGKLLGTVRLRPRLNEHLQYEGGQIGYDVSPSERGRGHGTRLMARALQEARRLGLDRVLVTCDADNLASVRVIEKSGGKLEDEVVSKLPEKAGKIVRRYWINL